MSDNAAVVDRSVQMQGVCKTYRTRGEPVHALDEVTLDIADGEFVSLLGPSGCGKSTLLLMVAGLVKPSKGQVTVAGHPVTKPVTDVGIVFQEHVLLDWRKVMANVLLQVEMRGLDKRQYVERAKELLALVGLTGFEERYPFELSGGMRQRVSICRALLHDPPLLLMDEPFGALDALTRDQLNLDVQTLWTRSPKTVVFVTHSIPEAVFLSDRVVVMSPRPGRIERVIEVELPRPRPLAVRETPEFGAYTREIVEIFDSLGVIREPSAAH